MPPTLGQRLRYARKARGIRQQEAAPLLQTDQTTLSRWETGRRTIPADRVPMIEAFIAGRSPQGEEGREG